METVRGCYNCTYRINLNSIEKCRMTHIRIPLDISCGADCLYWIKRRCSNCSWNDCIDTSSFFQQPENCLQYLFATE